VVLPVTPTPVTITAAVLRLRKAHIKAMVTTMMTAQAAAPSHA
jgi:hypothetical protein